MIDAAYQGGSGEPLVLLHGLTASWRIWAPVLPALERHHAVFAPALAGHHGGPPLIPDTGGIPAICDALEQTLDAAGITSAHLVGNSLGGWVAMELASRGRARSVVALAPVGHWRTQAHRDRLVRTFRRFDGQVARHRALLVSAARRPGLRRLLLRGSMQHGERMSADAAVGLIDDIIATTILAGLADWLEEEPPFAAELPAGLPVRIAWGTEDRTTSYEAYGAPWRDRLPEAEFVDLPGCGHVAMFDDPDLVVTTILEVTQGLGAAPGTAASES